MAKKKAAKLKPKVGTEIYTFQHTVSVTVRRPLNVPEENIEQAFSEILDEALPDELDPLDEQGDEVHVTQVLYGEGAEEYLDPEETPEAERENAAQ